MSKNELRSSGKHRRCGFANGARELRTVGSALAQGEQIGYNIGNPFSQIFATNDAAERNCRL